jgi:hypothetical protein
VKINNAAFIFVCLFIFLSVNNANAGKPVNPFSALLDGLVEQAQNLGNKVNSSNTETRSPQDKPYERPPQPLEKQIIYSGYSQAFVPVKELVAAGKAEEATRMYADRDKKTERTLNNKDLPKDTEELIRSNPGLAFLEGGTLSVDCGNSDKAVESFACAEDLFARQEMGSKLGSWIEKAGTFSIETLLGNEELQPYKGEGYERVLMLNYKSIAYLLQGERKAYNVTRRAIDWQNIEKKRFEKKLRDAKEKVAEKEKDNDSPGFNIRETIDREYASMESKAVTVSNAYVNPFGYYVAGMVQEFESYDDLSLRDNARISYKKALDLNPKSQVLQQAVKDPENPSAPSDKRLVHVVVADGFVPEKKLLILPLSIKGTVFPVKLPIYQPVPSQVHRIEICDGKGKRLANLSAVADVEAICLRHQKDSAPFRYLRVLLAAGRSYLGKNCLSRAGSIGEAGGDALIAMTTPDMRSWMSLPGSIQAVRLYVPWNLGKIRISTYDKKGERLASRTVTLDTTSHNFVYVRSINKTLYSHANQKMWLAMN